MVYEQSLDRVGVRDRDCEGVRDRRGDLRGRDRDRDLVRDREDVRDRRGDLRGRDRDRDLVRDRLGSS